MKGRRALPTFLGFMMGKNPASGCLNFCQLALMSYRTVNRRKAPGFLFVRQLFLFLSVSPDSVSKN